MLRAQWSRRRPWIQAVHRDVATLINAGVIDRTTDGIEFPYERIHFEYDVNAAA